MKELQFELMRGALENARFGICVVDASGRILLVNNVFVRKLATTVEAVLGQSYVVLAEYFAEHMDFNKLFDTQATELALELPLARAGVKAYFLLQSSALMHSSGEIFRIVSMMDVTDYGVTRDRFVELQRQMDAVNNSVVVVDARAADMPITYVNAHFERMTGYPKSEVIGRNCRFLQGLESEQYGLTTLRSAIQNGESCHVTLKNFRKDGSVFFNELYISPVFNEASELTHFIGIQHEVVGKVLAQP
jgi:PAS domain S-box-containing protein